jgi:hypothetical protein
MSANSLALQTASVLDNLNFTFYLTGARMSLFKDDVGRTSTKGNLHVRPESQPHFWHQKHVKQCKRIIDHE